MSDFVATIKSDPWVKVTIQDVPLILDPEWLEIVAAMAHKRASSQCLPLSASGAGPLTRPFAGTEADAHGLSVHVEWGRSFGSFMGP